MSIFTLQPAVILLCKISAKKNFGHLCNKSMNKLLCSICRFFFFKCSKVRRGNACYLYFTRVLRWCNSNEIKYKRYIKIMHNFFNLWKYRKQEIFHFIYTMSSSQAQLCKFTHCPQTPSFPMCSEKVKQIKSHASEQIPFLLSKRNTNMQWWILYFRGLILFFV